MSRQPSAHPKPTILLRRLLERFTQRTAALPTVSTGWQALEQGNAELAESIAKMHGQSGVGASEAMHLLAKARLSQGDWQAAQDAYGHSLSAAWSDEIALEWARLKIEKGTEDAFEWLKSLIARSPSNAAASLALSDLLSKTGKIDEAITTIMPVLESPPLVGQLAVDVYHFLVRLDRHDLAQLYLERALRDPYCPPEIQLLHLQTLTDAEPDATAISAARRYARLHPNHAQLQVQLGTLLCKAGLPDEASQAASQAVRLQPSNPQILRESALILEKIGQFESAVDNLELAVHFSPQDIDAWNSLMRVNFAAPDRHVAAETFARLSELHPDSHQTWFWRARIAEQDNRITDAIAAYEQCLAINPQWAPALTNLGLLRIERGDVTEAVELLSEVQRQFPLDAAAHLNLGMALRFAAQPLLALEHFDEAWRLEPADPITQYQRASLHLALGNFEEGWRQYESRWLQPHSDPKRFQYRPWNGEAIPDQTLTIWGEQGLGDQIMFASCISDAAARVKQCTVECHPRLTALFARSFPACRIAASPIGRQPEDVPESAHQIPMGTLPLLFRRDRSAFPEHNGYLRPDPRHVSHWQTMLNALPGKFRVGISWIGGVRQTGRARRSLNLIDWKQILTVPDVSFVSLQYTPCDDELDEVRSTLSCSIAHWQSAIDDLDQTAALMSQLDLVISVCNTVVHLGGALNIPTLVLTPKVPEWRYLAEGEKMSWYPSVSLIRQSAFNQWSDVMDEAERQLREFIARD